MKRIVALVIGILVFLSTVAYATEIDWDSMTLEEMLELQDEVTTQITKRLNSHLFNYILNGEYVCGEDIKPGVYVLSNPSDDYMYFRVYTDDEVTYGGRMKDGDLYRLDFKEGMMLDIYYGGGYLNTWIEPSWAP